MGGGVRMIDFVYQKYWVMGYIASHECYIDYLKNNDMQRDKSVDIYKQLNKNQKNQWFFIKKL